MYSHFRNMKTFLAFLDVCCFSIGHHTKVICNVCIHASPVLRNSLLSSACISSNAYVIKEFLKVYIYPHLRKHSETLGNSLFPSFSGCLICCFTGMHVRESLFALLYHYVKNSFCGFFFVQECQCTFPKLYGIPCFPSILLISNGVYKGRYRTDSLISPTFSGIPHVLHCYVFAVVNTHDKQSVYSSQKCSCFGVLCFFLGFVGFQLISVGFRLAW